MGKPGASAKTAGHIIKYLSKNKAHRFPGELHLFHR
jgi:hypothetical protein